MTEMDLDKITEKIIACAYAVSNTLGTGFVEKVYENAQAHEMTKSGLEVVQPYPIKVVMMESWSAISLLTWWSKTSSWLN